MYPKLSVPNEVKQMKDRMDPSYQREVSMFVDREVIYCVSSLIYELAQMVEQAPIEYQDDLYGAFISEADYDDEEDCYREVYEHWIVSSWLGDKLEERGEKVIRNLFGLQAVWCRTTTGQAIAMDEVIQNIWDSLS
jgi:hypothetical protein